MKTYLITFGLDTIYRDKCLLITADDYYKVVDYAYSRYGRLNVAMIYDYETHKDCINKYQYSIMERVTI